MNRTMSGGEAVVATLIANEIDTIFGIPGVHTLPVYDAINRLGIRHVLARHEQGAGFMAEGYARASGRIGVASVITGPGLTNIATPMASAFADSIPLLVIASAAEQNDDPHSRLRGELHDLKNQLGVMQALAGFAREVTTLEDIPEVLNAAIGYLANERPRGAYVQIPKNLLKAQALFSITPAAVKPPREPAQHLIDEAVQLLRSSIRPLIIAGAGVTAADANDYLTALAEKVSAPVIIGAKSHDVMPTTHPLAIPTTYVLPDEVIKLAAASDVALVVGSKLGAERMDYGTLTLPEHVIQIDIDETEIGRDIPVEISIVADAGTSMRAILNALADYTHEVDSTHAPITRETRIKHATSEFGNGVEYILALDEVLPDDVIVSVDMTRLGYASSEVLTSRYPRTYLHSSELCAIGCGLPTAIGAKAAKPEHPVVAICGDGGFLLNTGELACAQQEGLPVVIVVFNDHSFEAVKTEQISQYGSAIATELQGPDYVALAKSFGASGVLVKSPEELQRAAKEAFQSPERTTLIEVTL